MMRLRACLLAALFLLAARPAPALPVPDQENFPGDVLPLVLAPGYVWGQTVTAGLPGRLARIELLAERTDPPPRQDKDVILRVRVGGLLAAQESALLPGDAPDAPYLLGFDLTSWAVDLKAGDVWLMEVEAQGPGEDYLHGTWHDDYPGGRLYLDGQPYPSAASQEYDLAFREYVILPEPASWLMTAVGVLGALGVRRGRPRF